MAFALSTMWLWQLPTLRIFIETRLSMLLVILRVFRKVAIVDFDVHHGNGT
jgi:hypothetical protein